MPGPGEAPFGDRVFPLSDLPHDPDLGPEGEAAPRPEPTGWAELWLVTAVVVGGFVGVLGRYELGLAWPTATGHFPTATFVINTSGALVLGALLTFLSAPPARHPRWRAFFGTGVLGGWTTYSTLAVESVTLLQHGHLGPAVGYLAATLAASLAAVGVGMALGRSLVRLVSPPAPAEAR